METPILFIIFNRPETTKNVFEAIRQIKPKKLFIAADGPRDNKAGEKDLCDETKKIVLGKIDWPCEVKTLFRDKNLGCGKAVSQAINWFFDNVEEGIILEDDCLPDQTFFQYCTDLLNKYRSNEKIFMISGDNFLPKSLRPKESYYFSQIPHIWGWATWKRAWQKYNFEMNDFPTFKEEKIIEKIWSDKKAQNYWLEKLNITANGDLDTWDYQWVYTIWKNRAYSIVPNVNLVTNIGFGDQGTNTKNPKDISANIPLEGISFPLTNSATLCDIGDNYENKQSYPKNLLIKKILRKIGLFKYTKSIYLKLK